MSSRQGWCSTETYTKLLEDRVCLRRANIEIDEILVREGRKLTQLKTKREIVDKALELLVRSESYLSQWEPLEPSGLRTYRKAAAIFRLGRAKGVSRTTTDVLIAAVSLEHRASVFTGDCAVVRKIISSFAACSSGNTEPQQHGRENRI